MISLFLTYFASCAMGQLIGWTDAQIDGYLAFRDRATSQLDRFAPPPPIAGTRNWQVLEVQSGDADGDGFYPGWTIEGARHPERNMAVRIESLDGRRLAPGRYYAGYL